MLRHRVPSILLLFALPLMMSARACAQAVTDPTTKAVELFNSSRFAEEEVYLKALLAKQPRMYYAYRLLWDAEAHTTSETELLSRVSLDVQSLSEIPRVSRSEFFYYSYSYGLDILGRTEVAARARREELERFPTGRAMQSHLLEQAANEPSPLKADSDYKALIRTYKSKQGTITEATKKDFELRSDHPELFEKQQIAEAAEAWRRAVRQYTSLADPTYEYLSVLEQLAQYYVKRDPSRALEYCNLGTAYVDQTWAATTLYDHDYGTTFWPIELAASVNSGQWKRGVRLGDELEPFLLQGRFSVLLISRSQEAAIRVDYARALEGAGNPVAAFRQFGIASILDQSKTGELASFAAAHPETAIAVNESKSAWRAYVGSEIADRKKQLTESVAKHEIDDVAAPFVLDTVDSTKVSLHDFIGKPLVLLFWASWCHYCEQELTQLSAFLNSEAKARFNVLTISVDTDKNAATRLIQKLAPPFRVAFSDGNVDQYYHTSTIPQLYVLDGENRIRFHLQGVEPEFGTAMKTMIDIAEKASPARADAAAQQAPTR